MLSSQFVPFGKYYVRIGSEVKPFPWNVNAWLKFGLIPKTDRLLLMKSLFNTLYMINTGSNLQTALYLNFYLNISITDKVYELALLFHSWYLHREHIPFKIYR